MDINSVFLLPETIVSLTGILLMLVIPFCPKNRQNSLGYLALLGLGLALLVLFFQWDNRGTAFFNMVQLDLFGQFCKAFFIFTSGTILLISMSYLEREQIYQAEFYSLLLFSTTGMFLMACSMNLILTFLGLEILSISTYILIAARGGERKSGESALKYFILGAFSTAILLYGIALVYGATGSARYDRIAVAVPAVVSDHELYPLLLTGLGFILVGFGFKIALVPFHVWAPDVYEGAPIPITAHLAVSAKAAALLALVRILDQMLPELSQHWREIVGIAAVLTMLLGNIAALTQSNIKRMLAYSSIAHAGYLMIGIAAYNRLGTQGLLFYLAAYALMSMGAFSVVQILSRRTETSIQLDDYRGIGHRQPFLGMTLSIFLLSLAGIPTTAGFMGKLFVFTAALESGMYGLVLIALAASAIGIYYYLRVIVLMYMSEPGENSALPEIGIPLRLVIIVMVIGTIYLGILPGMFLGLAGEAVLF